jgi:hypothetical protein
MFNREERVDILQQLTSSKLREHPLRVVVNSVLFFEAAYETLSSSTAFLIHLLTNHTHIQKKVRDELRLVMGGDTELNYAHLKELKYMEQVIKEALRMFPPQTTFIGRGVNKGKKVLPIITILICSFADLLTMTFCIKGRMGARFGSQKESTSKPVFINSTTILTFGTTLKPLTPIASPQNARVRVRKRLKGKRQFHYLKFVFFVYFYR